MHYLYLIVTFLFLVVFATFTAVNLQNVAIDFWPFEFQFAAGGIFYLILEHIAPQAKLAYHWAPPLGAVFGFMLGMAGPALVG